MSVRVVTRDRVGSTNDEAVALAEAGESLPLAVRALEQIAGRGRLSRSWASPRGGVWLSVVGSRDGVVAGSVALRTALAVLDAVRPEVAGDHGHFGGSRGDGLSIKWPNDLLLEGKKIAGVLCERRSIGDGSSCLVIGVGVNADFEAEILPRNVRTPAMTLRTALGRPVDADAIAARLVGGLGAVLARTEAPLNGEELRRVLDRMAYLDERVSFARLDGRVVSGVLAGLAPDGRAALRVGDEIEWVNAGDVDRAGGGQG